MELWQQLDVRPGVLCLTGSGGKTTLAKLLAGTLPGRVIFCTTTHIYPPTEFFVLTDANAARLRLELERRGRICLGTPAEDGKLTAPSLNFELLREAADYVVVEADGARGLPMKAHAPHEPVLPPRSGRNLLLVGARGFGQPIARAVHRPERFARLAGLSLEAPITPEAAAAVLRREGGFDTVVVNQAADEKSMDAARRLAALLDVPVFAGELQKGRLIRLA